MDYAKPCGNKNVQQEHVLPSTSEEPQRTKCSKWACAYEQEVDGLIKSNFFIQRNLPESTLFWPSRMVHALAISNCETSHTKHKTAAGCFTLRNPNDSCVFQKRFWQVAGKATGFIDD